MSCCLPPDEGGRVRAAQTSNQCLTPDISSHTGARSKGTIRGAHCMEPRGERACSLLPHSTNLGAKWGAWLMVCVLALSRAPPSPAMALGSRHIHGIRTSWETSLQQTLKEQKLGTLQPVVTEDCFCLSTTQKSPGKPRPQKPRVGCTGLEKKPLGRRKTGLGNKWPPAKTGTSKKG